MSAYDASEQTMLLDAFRDMLSAVTKDGGNKRARGEKPPWWKDPSHEAAIWSHVNKWKHGELVDKDSGVHPLVHLAWRALAIAWQESRGKVDPVTLQPKEPQLWVCSRCNGAFLEDPRHPEHPIEHPCREYTGAFDPFRR